MRLSKKRRYEILAIEGHYESDILEGNGSISYTNGEKLICMFVGGVPNGPAKLFDSDNHIKQVITLNISDEFEPSWLVPLLELKDFWLGS